MKTNILAVERHLGKGRFRFAVPGLLPSRTVRTLCLLWLVGVPQLAEATTENPFELPAARDPQAPGSVMLHGGGSGLGDEVRREFVRLAGGRSARIVLMPAELAQRGFDDDGKPLAKVESRADFERRLSDPREYGRWVGLRERGEVTDFQSGD